MKIPLPRSVTGGPGVLLSWHEGLVGICGLLLQRVVHTKDRRHAKDLPHPTWMAATWMAATWMAASWFCWFCWFCWFLLIFADLRSLDFSLFGAMSRSFIYESTVCIHVSRLWSLWTSLSISIGSLHISCAMKNLTRSNNLPFGSMICPLKPPFLVFFPAFSSIFSIFQHFPAFSSIFPAFFQHFPAFSTPKMP